MDSLFSLSVGLFHPYNLPVIPALFGCARLSDSLG
jgi:hypothetical protein